MRTMVFAVAAAAAALTALPFSVAPVNADPVRMAQVDVDVGVGPRPHDRGVIIEERRRPGVIIEETEGRRRDCVTHSESVTRGNGTTVTEQERNCR
jgi:hypothetical protein